MYYARPVTGSHNLLERITSAYTAFGLTPPTRATEIRKIVESGARNVRAVADTHARDAFLSDTDPQDWYDNAIEAIKEAHARELLADIFAQQYQQNLKAASTALLAPAGTDLAKPVTKIINALVKAAQDLPHGNPLDAEAVIGADAGAQLTTVRNALATLSEAAGIYDTITGRNEVPDQALRSIVPIVEFPPAAIEIVERSINDAPKPVLNRDELDGTYTIRQIREDLNNRIDVDTVLVRIAQGHYPGATISFAASPAEHTARIRNVGRAYQTVNGEAPSTPVAVRL